LVNLEREGLVRVVGSKRDEVNRRDTPLYEPVLGWDAHAFVPQPQREASRQLLADRRSRSDEVGTLPPLKALSGKWELHMPDGTVLVCKDVTIQVVKAGKGNRVNAAKIVAAADWDEGQD
jgi:hypothetical protein